MNKKNSQTSMGNKISHTTESMAEKNKADELRKKKAENVVQIVAVSDAEEIGKKPVPDKTIEAAVEELNPDKNSMDSRG